MKNKCEVVGAGGCARAAAAADRWTAAQQQRLPVQLSADLLRKALLSSNLNSKCISLCKFHQKKGFLAAAEGWRWCGCGPPLKANGLHAAATSAAPSRFFPEISLLEDLICFFIAKKWRKKCFEAAKAAVERATRAGLQVYRQLAARSFRLRGSGRFRHFFAILGSKKSCCNAAFYFN